MRRHCAIGNRHQQQFSFGAALIDHWLYRQVGGVLRRLPPESTLPWHRVVNRYGQISLQGDDLLRQRDALEAEGVVVSEEGGIDMARYRWEI
ncbi:hypothetical protein CRX72_10600 [Pantoea sp. BRM17]|nr:hypothetical protein CRX72_10600 [Pantoea sp. BRM17]